MTNQDAGARGELIASAWLLTQGYEVFRNVSPHGPADLVAWDPATGETWFIDVKSREVVSSTGRIQLGKEESDRTNAVGVLVLAVVAGQVLGFVDGYGQLLTTSPLERSSTS